MERELWNWKWEYPEGPAGKVPRSSRIHLLWKILVVTRLPLNHVKNKSFVDAKFRGSGSLFPLVIAQNIAPESPD